MEMMKTLPLIAWFLAAGSAGNVLAAELTEDTFLSDLPMVLTASRIAQSPLDAPAPVSVIDRETIRASGFTEIHELLRLVPGFLVADWPEGPPTVVNHGLGDANSRRMQVLVDGLSVYDPFRGGVAWQDIPLRVEDIERIEVVRAPSQAVYGANAFQGVINIITLGADAEPGAGIVIAGGQRGFEDEYLRLGRAGRVVDWRISASHRQANNFRDLGRDLFMIQEDIERWGLNGQVAWHPSNDQELRAYLGLGWGNDDTGTRDSTSNPPRDRDNRDRFFQLSWRSNPSAAAETTLRYYHYSRKEREGYRVYATNLALAPVPFISVGADIDMRRNGIEFQRVDNWSGALQTMWGAGLRHDQVESEHLLYGLGDVGGVQKQIFGNLDWTFAPSWQLNLGAMVEDHYNTDMLLSPRLALNFKVAPEQALRLSVGRSYRAPTIEEASVREVMAYSGGIADVGKWAYRDLDPERVDFIELGYVARFAPLGLRLDARLFQDNYRDYIDDQSCILDPEASEFRPDGVRRGVRCEFAPPPGYERPLGFAGFSWGDPSLPNGTLPRFSNFKAFYFFNSGEIKVRGGDVTLDWRNHAVGRILLTHAITQISAEGVGLDSTSSAASVTRDNDMAVSAPRHATSLLWSRGWPWGLETSVGFYHVGAMKWPNDGDDQPAYRRWDFRLAKRLAGAGDEIALTLQNFNGDHTEFDDYVPEHQAFVTLRLNW
jgi:iron complex outermembrane receptor protein